MHAILALNRTNNVKELQQFLGMVKYYKDMWAKRSEMLAPLTDLVGECEESKATKKNGTKKEQWRWEAIHQQAFDNVQATLRKLVFGFLELIAQYLLFAQVLLVVTWTSSLCERFFVVTRAQVFVQDIPTSCRLMSYPLSCKPTLLRCHPL